MSWECIYTAAHAHFPDTEPLGGGKAVADYLCRAHPQWTVLSPARLGIGGRLVEFTEREYARFCRQFERATTRAIRQHDPRRCVVVSNDISEGPAFRVLGDLGYRVVTIVHVDVVEYFTKFYLRGWLSPATAARWLDRRWLPDVLRLVFEKQRECVRQSTRIVVPSPPMKAMIRRCYPWCPAEKIVVLPWGNIAAPAPPTATPYPADEFVIMTLSRLSPEKGVERLLAALPLVRGKCRVLIGGAAAFMRGKRYERKLRQLADARVEFLGHVTGPHKAALLHRADLFVSPSRHESYGLTIAEAAAAGCRILSHAHYGAAGTVVDCGDRHALAAVIDALIAGGRRPKTPAQVTPSTAAAELERLLQEVAG